MDAPIFSTHMTVALVTFVVVVAFAIVVEEYEVSFVCRVEVGFFRFVPFGVTVAVVTFVTFDIIFFAGGVEVGFNVVVSFSVTLAVPLAMVTD